MQYAPHVLHAINCDIRDRVMKGDLGLTTGFKSGCVCMCMCVCVCIYYV